MYGMPVAMAMTVRLPPIPALCWGLSNAPDSDARETKTKTKHQYTYATAHASGFNETDFCHQLLFMDSHKEPTKAQFINSKIMLYCETRFLF